MEQVNGHDPAGVTQEAKMMYMERVYKMTHGELFHELMRVHTESARMIMEMQAEIARLNEADQDDGK
jgi:hypothetical protein